VTARLKRIPRRIQGRGAGMADRAASLRSRSRVVLGKISRGGKTGVENTHREEGREKEIKKALLHIFCPYRISLTPCLNRQGVSGTHQWKRISAEKTPLQRTGTFESGTIFPLILSQPEALPPPSSRPPPSSSSPSSSSMSVTW